MASFEEITKSVIGGAPTPSPTTAVKPGSSFDEINKSIFTSPVAPEVTTP